MIRTEPARFRVAVTVFALATSVVLGAAACEAKKEEPKKEEPKSATTAPAEPGTTDEAKTAEAAPEEKPEEKAEEKPEEKAAEEYVKVTVGHHNPEQGPVEAVFTGFELVAAKIDFDDLSQSFADYKVDASTFTSDNSKRDDHVRNPDFLNVPSFAHINFRVHSLQPVDGAADTYTATATLELIGVKKDVPVEFKIVEKGDDGTVTVEGTGTFKRSEFSLGKAPEEANVADDIKVDVRLKLKNTGA